VETIRSVNMHQLGVNFVERVLDVRSRHTDDGKAAAPGESIEFLGQIRGWQSEERKKRNAHLLQLNDIGIRVALGHAVGTDVSSSRKHTLRRRPRSKETKDGGIKYGQS
jgi:hypothetical protein